MSVWWGQDVIWSSCGLKLVAMIMMIPIIFGYACGQSGY